MNHVPEVRRIEVVDPAMADVYRRKTPAERIAMICDANETMRLLIAGRLRTEHPDWDYDRISQEVARRMLRESS
jgi:hypothetical protein